jgi:hypothetical protein
VAGNRNISNGSLDNVGSRGTYWSGPLSGSGARRLSFDWSLAIMYGSARALGLSVRCLKD